MLFPNAPASFVKRNACEGPTPSPGLAAAGAWPADKLERDPGHGGVGKVPVQRGLGRRFLVRVEAIRKRLLDEDNLCAKYHVDLCRYAGALPDDAPGTAHIEISQRKAEPKEEESTEIEIYEILP